MANVIIRTASVQFLASIEAGLAPDYSNMWEESFAFGEPAYMTREELSFCANLATRLGQDASVYTSHMATAPTDAEVYPAEMFTSIPELPTAPVFETEEGEVVNSSTPECGGNEGDEPTTLLERVEGVAYAAMLGAAIFALSIVPMILISAGTQPQGGAPSVTQVAK